MDFSLTETQQAITEAARSVFAGSLDHDRLALIEHSTERIDRDIWKSLAAADLLGINVPSDDGGLGLGLTEVCCALIEQGSTLAPVPLWATLCLGVSALAAAPQSAPARRWLPTIATGSAIATAAISEWARSDGRDVAVRAADGQLNGQLEAVPSGTVADVIVVAARDGEGTTMVIGLDPSAAGISYEFNETTNRELHPNLVLEAVAYGPDDVLAEGAAAEALLGDVALAAQTGLCALALGVARAALTQTATYLNERLQFGRPLSTFQGTMLKAADAFIDMEAMEVTMWQAAWRIDTGRDGAEAVAAAKFHAAEGGQRVVHATQHLHGGIGADTSYPIHRYFLWGKQIELMLGGPSSQLSRLGAMIADGKTSRS